MQKPKGTYDVLPKDSKKWQYLEDVFRSICAYYNYKEIRTPLFERTEVFHRSSGEESDIVKKETYTFNDRGNRSMTLRPEGTAAVVRAFDENNLYADVIHQVKVYYMAQMVRYERPKAGRLREFYQLSVELFGCDKPEADSEVINLAINCLTDLGLTKDDFFVKINKRNILKNLLLKI